MQLATKKEHIEVSHTSDIKDLAQQEIYMVVRQKASSRKKSKGNSKKQYYQTSEESIQVNQTLRLAARGYKNSQRLKLETSSQGIGHQFLHRQPQQKKKGFFFLCC